MCIDFVFKSTFLEGNPISGESVSTILQLLVGFD